MKKKMNFTQWTSSWSYNEHKKWSYVCFIASPKLIKTHVNLYVYTFFTTIKKQLMQLTNSVITIKNIRKELQNKSIFIDGVSRQCLLYYLW